jgi:DNA-binding NtrC family response regulator
LPPLRQRAEDVPLLVRYFLQRFSPNRTIEITEAALACMAAYPWPGNVRELQNAVERMVVLNPGEQLDLAHLPAKVRLGRPPSESRVVNLPAEGYSLESIEREVVVQALERSGWNQTRAAAFLQVPRHTLLYRMDKYEIKKP